MATNPFNIVPAKKTSPFNIPPAKPSVAGILDRALTGGFVSKTLSVADRFAKLSPEEKKKLLETGSDIQTTAPLKPEVLQKNIELKEATQKAAAKKFFDFEKSPLSISAAPTELIEAQKSPEAAAAYEKEQARRRLQYVRQNEGYFPAVGEALKQYGQAKVEAMQPVLEFADTAATKVEEQGHPILGGAVRGAKGLYQSSVGATGEAARQLGEGNVGGAAFTYGLGKLMNSSPTGMAWTAVMEQKPVKEYVQPVLDAWNNELDTFFADQKNNPFSPIGSVLKESGKLLPYLLFDKVSRIPFKSKKTITLQDGKTFEVPTDRKWYAEAKKSVFNDILQLANDPAKFFKEKQFGLSIRAVGDEAEKGKMTSLKDMRTKLPRAGIEKPAPLPEDKTMMAVHNLNAGNLIFADKIGGLANPSLALFEPSKASFEGFGDITLVAPKDMIDPSKISKGSVFAADAYSPRFPGSEFRLDYKTQDSVRDSLKKYENIVGKEASQLDLSDNPERQLENSSLMMAKFLESKGAKPNVITENGKIETYSTLNSLREQIKEYDNGQEFVDFIEETLKSTGAERKMFAGYTPSGQRRYKDLTVEEASKLMNKEAIKGGENFYYGLGSIRALILPKFKSISEIKKSKNKVVTREKLDVEIEKNDKVLKEILDDLDQYATHKQENPFSEHSTQSQILAEYMAGKDRGFFKEKFQNVPSEILGRIQDFKKVLKDMPTEYFEAKFKRPVSISEFLFAVIPDNTSVKARKILEKNNIPVIEYKAGDEVSRRRALELATQDKQPLELATRAGEKPVFAFKEKPREGGISEEARARAEVKNELGGAVEEFRRMAEILPKFKNAEEFSTLYEIASRKGKIPAINREAKLINEIVDKGIDSYNFTKLGELVGREYKDPFGKDFFEQWEKGIVPKFTKENIQTLPQKTGELRGNSPYSSIPQSQDTRVDQAQTLLNREKPVSQIQTAYLGEGQVPGREQISSNNLGKQDILPAQSQLENVSGNALETIVPTKQTLVNKVAELDAVKNEFDNLTEEIRAPIEAEIYNELAHSKAGERYQLPDGTFTGMASTFPKWIPYGDLRTSDLVQKVMKSMFSGKELKGKAGQLQEIVLAEIEKRMKPHELYSYYSEMRDYVKKLQTETAQEFRAGVGDIGNAEQLPFGVEGLEGAPLEASQLNSKNNLQSESVLQQEQVQAPGIFSREDMPMFLQKIDKSQLSADQISAVTKQLKVPSSGIIQQLSEVQIERTNSSLHTKVNLLDWFRTPDRVLEKIGLGKEATKLKKSYNLYLDELPKEIDRVTKWWERVKDSPDSSRRIFQYLDGQEVGLNPKELKVASEMKDYLVKWADKLGLPPSNRIANYITHIFDEDFIKKEFDQDLAKLIAEKIPGSVYDPFLQQRLGKLGYIEDAFRALDAYVKRATRKYYMDPALKSLKEAADPLDLDSFRYVQSLAERVNLRPTQIDNYLDNLIKQSFIGYKFGARPTARVSRFLRQTVYRGTLGLNFGSAVRNLSQGANTYAMLGEKYTVLGYMKAIREMVTRGTELERVGVLRDNIIQDRQLSAVKGTLEKLDKGLWIFFNATEKINRGAAYFGAKARAIKRGLSELEATEVGVEAARKTQFSFGSVDTPVALQSDLVKTFMQFQSYNIKQAEFLSEMIRNKQFAGLVRWTSANLLFMATIGSLFGYDLKDMIPFSGVLTGETKLGATPPIQLGSEIMGALMDSPDDYGKPRTAKRKLTDVLTKLKPFVPAGVQLSKTADTVKALMNNGQVKSSTGKTTNFVIRNKSIPNLAKGLLFGQYATEEGQKYLNRNKRTKSLFNIPSANGNNPFKLPLANSSGNPFVLPKAR